MKSVRIYHNVPDGLVLALRIVLDADGKAIFIPGDDYAETARSILGEAVGSFAQRRVVNPEDGEPYLEAVVEFLRGSSYWIPYADDREVPTAALRPPAPAKRRAARAPAAEKPSRKR